MSSSNTTSAMPYETEQTGDSGPDAVWYRLTKDGWVGEDDPQVTLFLTRSPTGPGGRCLWAITIYNEALERWWTYGARKSKSKKSDGTCRLIPNEGDPGNVGIQYMWMGRVPLASTHKVRLLCESTAIDKAESEIFVSRKYVKDVVHRLEEKGFLSQQARKRTLREFSLMVDRERQRQYQTGWMSFHSKRA
ncbi:hypothetical protein ACHAPT_011574 [Fusarium lateritium]